MPTDFWARTDSGTANNPALNLTNAPAVSISFAPNGAGGDISLEYDGGAIDPDTQVVIDGVAYDFIFELSATLPTQKNNGAQQVPDQLEGDPIYVITVIDYPSPGTDTRLAFLPEDEPTQAEMDDFGNGAIDLQNIDTTTPGVVCFGQGTLIATPDGEKPVEDLRAGDLVKTAGGDELPILWISSTTHYWPGSPEKALPILISAGALGHQKPRRDLVVSPQHKVLLSRALPGAKSQDNVLAPALGLTNLPGIRRMRGKRTITYFHILLERHALLLSEHLASESFYPGPMAMKMLRADQRRDVSSLLPNLLSDVAESYGAPARPCLTHTETQAYAASLKEQMLVASK